MSLIYSSVKKDFLYWNVLIFIMELTDEVNTLRKSNSYSIIFKKQPRPLSADS